MINPKIFRAYDIRGNSTNDLSPEIAYKIGFAFAKRVITGVNKLICVGRDGRLSSPQLCHGLISGLENAGATVKYIGIVATPMLYFADKKFKAAGSIMVTGSHNPKEDNGFKMLQDNKSFFDQDIQKLKRDIANIDWSEVNINLIFADYPSDNINHDYIERILQDFQISDKLKVAFDPANGAAGEVMQLLAKKLPCQTLIINGEINGNFPAHAPDPTVEKNLQQLKDFVIKNDCDLGIGFDGDGDRIGVITNKGQMVYGDQLLCLYAKQILESYPGSTVIADVKASNVLFDYVNDNGGKACMWKTGHAFIKTKMQETKALLAGEMSGHIFFADEYYGYDDAIYAAIRLLDILSSSDITIDEMINLLSKTFSTPELRIEVDEENKFKIIEQVKEHTRAKGIDFVDVDGLRVNTENGWWLLRASNTQNSISARCESSTSEGLEILQQELKTILAKHGVNL